MALYGVGAVADCLMAGLFVLGATFRYAMRQTCTRQCVFADYSRLQQGQPTNTYPAVNPTQQITLSAHET